MSSRANLPEPADIGAPPPSQPRPRPSPVFWITVVGVFVAAEAAWLATSRWRNPPTTAAVKQPPGDTAEVPTKLQSEVAIEDAAEVAANRAVPFPAAKPPPPERALDELDPAKQKYIWDAEHITFEIEQRFGKVFKAALAARDRPTLLKLFRQSFEGHVLVRPAAPPVRRHGPVAERRFGGDGAATRAVDAAGLIDELLDSLAPLKVIDDVGLRVLKIDRTAERPSQRWTTTVLLTAAGRDGRQRLLSLDSEHRVDFEFQSKVELDGGRVVSRWRAVYQRMRGCRGKLMEEVTAASGLDKLPLRDNWLLMKSESPQQFHFQMAVEDFDRDGYLDVAVASVHGFPLLLRSIDGKQFADVTAQFGFPRWKPESYRYLAAWVDYDNDGFPDLILGDRLYHNVGGRQFDDVTHDSGLHFNERPMACAVADYDGDGKLDLYVCYQFADANRNSGPVPWVGDDSSGKPNQLWHNEGGGRFRDVTEASGTGGGMRNSFAAAWLYADDDPLPDLYVANDFGTNVMLRNRGDGTFEDVSDVSGVADYATSMGVAAGDLDNDGLPELYVANMYSKMGRRIIAHVGDADYSPGIYQQIMGACAGNRLYRRGTGSPGYRELSTTLGVNGIGWAFAPAMVDLDNDGLLDLYATTGFMSFQRGKPDG